MHYKNVLKYYYKGRGNFSMDILFDGIRSLKLHKIEYVNNIKKKAIERLVHLKL